MSRDGNGRKTQFRPPPAVRTTAVETIGLQNENLRFFRINLNPLPSIYYNGHKRNVADDFRRNRALHTNPKIKKRTSGEKKYDYDN